MCTLTPSSTVIEERLTKLFPPDWLDRQARLHEVVERDRKLDITALAWALVLGFAIGDSRSIEKLRRTYVRFADHHLVPSSFHELVSYAGLDPVVKESGETQKEGGISKKGSSNLRWILVQCANVAVRTVDDPYLGRFYTRLKRRKNHQVAIVATARKMLVSIFHMLDRKEVYDPPGVPS